MLFLALCDDIECKKDNDNGDAQKEAEKKEKINKLFIEKHDALVSYSDTILNCTSDAEDIVQDVFLLLMYKYDETKEENVEGWLYKTTYNLSKNFVRKEKNREKILICISSDVPTETELSYSIEYESDILDAIKDGLSESDYAFFQKHFLCSTYNPTNLSNAQKVKKHRIKNKVIKILKEKSIFFDSDE